MRLACYILACGTMFSSGVCAIEQPSEKWKGDAELGVLLSNGNTQTENINAKLGVLNERPQWRHELRLEAWHASDADTTTAEKYFASGKTDYKLNAFDYLFGTVSYDADRFSGYEYQAIEALGYGRRLAATERVTFDVEAGPGMRQSKTENGESQNDAILRAAAKLNWNLSTTSVFSESLATEIGGDVVVSKSITALKTNVAGNLAMKLSFTTTYTSAVPPGFHKTDAQTAVTLVYNLL